MTTNKKTIYGLILAGGYSRRMGKDKALLDFHGKPQVQFCYDLLTAYCEKVFVSARANQQYFNLPILKDLEKFANIGPLGGILSAMETYPDVAWLLLACDLPNVEDKTITHLLAHREDTKISTAYISSTDKLPEPLCAIWEPHAKDEILRYLKDDIKCPRKILIRSNVLLLPLPVANWLDNINTPLDLKGYSKETVS